jgi:phage terminase large subunit-like protein
MQEPGLPYHDHVPLVVQLYPDQAHLLKLAGFGGECLAPELGILHQPRSGASRWLMIAAVRIAYEHPGARVLVLGRDLETMRQDWAQPESGIWKLVSPMVAAGVCRTAHWYVGFPLQDSRLTFRMQQHARQVPDATHLLIDDAEAVPAELYQHLRERVLSRPPLPTEGPNALRLVVVGRPGVGWPAAELRAVEGQRVVVEMTGRGMDASLREPRALAAPAERLSLRETILRAEPRYRLLYPHEMMIWAGQLALDREIDVLLLSAPPGVGKSWIVSSGIPCAELRERPQNQGLVVCSTDKLAGKASKTAKRWLREVGGRIIRGADALYSWETVQGGGYEARGKGSALLGHRGDVIVYDDPFASPIEASRPSVQEVALAVWEMLETRVQRFGHLPAVRILMHQRLDSNDVLGRVLESEARQASGERIAFLNLQAIRRKLMLQVPSTVVALHETDDREDGEPLCEEILPARKLALLEERNPLRFRTLYQGDPPAGGGGDMFSRAHIVELERAPKFPDAYMLVVRSWDIGGSDKKESDPTASVLLGRLMEPLELENGKPVHWVVLDATCDQVRAVDLYDHIKAQADRDGMWVQLAIPEDPAAAGKIVYELFANQLAGAGVAVLKGSTRGSKRMRAVGLAGAVNPGPGLETGSLAVVRRRGTAIDELVDQLDAFTGVEGEAAQGLDPLAEIGRRGVHDDLVDAITQGFNLISMATGWSP